MIILVSLREIDYFSLEVFYFFINDLVFLFDVICVEEKENKKLFYEVIFLNKNLESLIVV